MHTMIEQSLRVLVYTIRAILNHSDILILRWINLTFVINSR